ncbi:DUF6233 domain-containing protein [Streptomyces rochei]|uniref:DUF6233 domain-containing protein n=1 Tax=Streptomyces rochei TaxID=1928 RepID=UPI0036794A29
MNDSGPTRLTLLRFLERVQLRDLERTRRWITDEERREAERRRGIEKKPATPDWLLERGLNGHSPPVYVHAGDCWNAGKRSTGAYAASHPARFFARWTFPAGVERHSDRRGTHVALVDEEMTNALVPATRQPAIACRFRLSPVQRSLSWGSSLR